MASEAELLAIKDRAAEELGRLPGVTGVGIGGRVRGGERIHELVLKVYVEAKRPAGQLEPSELVPAEFEGIPTDVSEMPCTGVLLQAAPSGKPAMLNPAGWRERPLTGGTQVKVDLPGGEFGTLGCILVRVGDDTEAYGLTTWHGVVGHQGVAASKREIPPVLGVTKLGQPEPSESSTKCCSAMVGKVAGGGRDGVRDAAVVKLDPGMTWSPDVPMIGPLRGGRSIDSTTAAAHPAVRKYGACSGLTGGTVASIETEVVADGVAFRNAMIVTPNPDTSLPAETPVFFSQHGDSGSALVNDANEVVGLVFGMPDPDEGPNPGYHGQVEGWALPIKDVIVSFAVHEHLALKVFAATTPGEVHTVPGAAMVAVPPEVTAVLLGDRAGAAEDEPAPVPVAGIGLEPPPPEALALLQQGLDRSERGRALITLWLSHQAELLSLVNSNRRVATVWHRSGASALFQLFVRMLSQPQLALPPTLNGEPLGACIDRVHAILGRFASAPLRRDMAEARAGLPELGGLDFDGVCRALEAG